MSQQPTIRSLEQHKEILLFNYREHFKFSKEIVQVLWPEHPKSISLHQETNAILVDIKKIEETIKQLQHQLHDSLMGP